MAWVATAFLYPLFSYRRTTNTINTTLEVLHLDSDWCAWPVH
jgi:hypothetical protein